MSGASGTQDADVQQRSLTLEELGPFLRGVDLSDWFNPFLRTFAREAILSGGRATVACDRDRVLGLALTDPPERTVSVFCRSPVVVGLLRSGLEELSTYAELDLGGPSEPFAIHRTDLPQPPAHRFRHRVRLLGPSELGGVAALLAEVYGQSADRWLAIAQAEGERCLGVDIDGELAGAAWVLLVGGHARLHSLAVRAGSRRRGVATDLVMARLLFAWSRGARTAVSEISERNVPSQRAAVRSGMRPVGRWFLYPGSRDLPRTQGGGATDVDGPRSS